MPASSPSSLFTPLLRSPARTLWTFLLGAALWAVCTGIDPVNAHLDSHDPTSEESQKVVAGIDPTSWILGIPAATLFTWFLLAGSDERLHIHYRALPAFMVYFVTQSFRSGLDVAYRALHPEQELNPGFCVYPARLPKGAPQALFANMISVLPGTLSWSLVDGLHKVHLLAGHPLILEDLAQLESRVATLYGIELSKELF